MATILVDYENVAASDGLKGVDALVQKDTLIIFYSDACRKIRQDYMRCIVDSGCEFHIVKLKNTGKNALDFYIAAECGRLGAQGEKEIAIITNDKGFQAILDYFKMNDDMSDICVVKAGNIENALMILNTPDNAKRSVALKERTVMLDLGEEYAKFSERQKAAKENSASKANITRVTNRTPERIYTVRKLAGTVVYRLGQLSGNT